MIETLPHAGSVIEIPPEHDPRVVDGAATRRRRLAQLSPAQRAALVLERYPELRMLPNIEWQRLSTRACFRMLFGESSRHFARLELAALAGVVASAGISPAYASEADAAVRSILDLLQQRFRISTPQAITLDVWEAWGRDTDLMRTLTMKLRMYAAAVDYHLADYRERLTAEDRARVAHLLLPAIPRQFWRRFVPAAEHRAEVRRRRKAKTDVVSECALAILALMLARYPSTERFIRWYRRQIDRIEAGELRIPAQLTYEDDELDLPRQPGPDAVNITDLRWRTVPVRLNLTIWRPKEFSEQRYVNWTQRTAQGTREHARAATAQHEWQRRTRTGVYTDPHAFFVEAHPSDAMPWFMPPVSRWYARLGQRRGGNAEADGRLGTAHAGLGTPEDWLVSYLGNLVAADRRAHFRARPDGVCFDPEATYRGVLFGTAVVTLMLTADARIHEILQISADRFVKPVRVYIVKRPDGTPKRDPATNRIVTDVMVEQRLLPKGRKRDDLRLPYDVSAARLHLQEITRLLKAAAGGEVPVVRYDPRHPKAEQLGAERFLFQWNGRHARKSVINSLIRFVLDGIVLVDRCRRRRVGLTATARDQSDMVERTGRQATASWAKRSSCTGPRRRRSSNRTSGSRRSVGTSAGAENVHRPA